MSFSYHGNKDESKFQVLDDRLRLKVWSYKHFRAQTRCPKTPVSALTIYLVDVQTYLHKPFILREGLRLSPKEHTKPLLQFFPSSHND